MHCSLHPLSAPKQGQFSFQQLFIEQLQKYIPAKKPLLTRADT